MIQSGIGLNSEPLGHDIAYPKGNGGGTVVFKTTSNQGLSCKTKKNE